MLCAVYDRRRRAMLSRCLADAFLVGPCESAELLARAGEVLTPRPRWTPQVVRAVMQAYHRPPSDRPRELAAFIARELQRSPAGPSRTQPGVR
jgi:hypothetical protein